MKVWQRMVTDVGAQIDEMAETLEEWADWAEAEGYPAISHKLQEARGPLTSAGEAARQYADGTLPEKTPPAYTEGEAKGLST